MVDRSKGFQRVQAGFAAHLRDPERVKPPEDVEPRRIKVYRDLFFNNMENFIGAGFPVLKSLFDEERWQQLVRDFYIEHHARTPLFIEIAREFVEYLSTERTVQPWDPPFLAELAHYEWVELALQVATDDPPPLDPEFSRELPVASIARSKVAWILSYHYPVQQIGPPFRPTSPLPNPQHLLVFRDREERVRFIELSPLASALLVTMDERVGTPIGGVLADMAANVPGFSCEDFMRFGFEFLQDLHSKGVVGRLNPGSLKP